jgi:hypothetical protein
VETTGSPFENESTFPSTENRATERRKGMKRESRFSHKDRKDPELEK